MHEIYKGHFAQFPVWFDSAPDKETMFQMEIAMYKSKARYGALMADHHVGYSVPVGGVVAYEGQICVNGVGFDIGCGNKAVRLDCDPAAAKANMYLIMNEVQKHIAFGIGRKNEEKIDHPLLDEPIWDELEVLKGLKDKARDQLGTVGAGNHYVDIFEDELGRIWVGVHFGSRGLGHTIATHFIKAAGGKDGVHADPVILGDTSDLGSQYLRCMELAGRYAYAGRDYVCSRVAAILRGEILEEIHNHHNFAWRERHFGKDLWVVRKGATPAFPGQMGFVGGSMGELSFILQGRSESDESAAALYSTVHGAGRAMGRAAAKGKTDKRGNIIRPGLVSREDWADWMKRMGVELRGGDVDEGPQCYKRIDSVIRAHSNTIDIVHTLKPLGVCMADGRTHDPYKD